MDTTTSKAGLGVLGAGAAACAACCAGPLLGFLAATGIASVLGAVAFGVAGLVIVLAVAAVLWQRRRRRPRQCDAGSGPAHIDAPQLNSTSKGLQMATVTSAGVDPETAFRHLAGP